MKKSIMLLLIFMTLLSFETFAQNDDIDDEGWILVSKDKSGAKYYTELISTIYLETDVFGVKKVWIKMMSPKTTIKKKGKSIVYNNTKSMMLYEINCKNKEIRNTQFVTYNTKGEIIESSEEFYGEMFKSVIPGSIGEAIFDKVCQ